MAFRLLWKAWYKKACHFLFLLLLFFLSSYLILDISLVHRRLDLRFIPYSRSLTSCLLSLLITSYLSTPRTPQPSNSNQFNYNKHTYNNTRRPRSEMKAQLLPNILLLAGTAYAGALSSTWMAWPANTTGIAYETVTMTAITTYCPAATVLTHNGAEYTVTAETTLTITDCPCTITRVCLCLLLPFSHNLSFPYLSLHLPSLYIYIYI
jgi:hypothetical protein